jgi:hypothetical protein
MSDAWLLVAAAVSAALVVQLLPEAQPPVPAEPLVPASQEPGLPALAHLVVDSALLLDLLRRQWYSAAMASSSP